MSVEACCTVEAAQVETSAACPQCGRKGAVVGSITLKALLRPERLALVEPSGYRFCATPDCPIVYFGPGGSFGREDLGVPVFQKEPPGGRTVCYCLAITEADLRAEIAEQGRSPARDRIVALVKADRCACELRNPQGSCCLGNVGSVCRAAEAARTSGSQAAAAG